RHATRKVSATTSAASSRPTRRYANAYTCPEWARYRSSHRPRSGAAKLSPASPDLAGRRSTTRSTTRPDPVEPNHRSLGECLGRALRRLSEPRAGDDRGSEGRRPSMGLRFSSILIGSDDPARLVGLYTKVLGAPAWDQGGYTGWQLGSGGLMIGPH